MKQIEKMERNTVKMIGLSVAYLIAYVLATGALVYVNVLCGQGDPLLDWNNYWTIWAVFFAPLSVIGTIAVWITQGGLALSARLHALFLGLIIGVIEISWLLDAHWVVVIAERGVLVVIFAFVVGKTRRSRTAWQF